MTDDITIRQARSADYEAVAEFTSETWPDRDSRDYIPRIYHEWIAADGEDQRTFVADAGDPAGNYPSDNIAGIVQGVLLSDSEAWSQGMRVAPTFRGGGLSTTLNEAVFAWAADHGATVCRNMVFSWNAAGLGGSRAAGFEPATEFRWTHPEPDSDSRLPDDGEIGVASSPAAAWQYWTNSDARTVLGGLALDLDESWALSELRRSDLHRAATETSVIVITRSRKDTAGSSFAAGHELSRRACALTYRVRDYEREADDGSTERWAEYGIGEWADIEAARALFTAIARDAANIGADRTRVLIPETPRHVTDAAWARSNPGEDPDFVFAADLTAWG